MPKFQQVYENEDGWSDWIQPVTGRNKTYKMCCCDCGLVHEVQFRIHHGKIQLRAHRNNRSTAQIRRHMRKRK